MSEKRPEIAVWSNNSPLANILYSRTEIDLVRFIDYGDQSASPFVMIFIDLAGDLTHLSHKIIEIYEHCRKKSQKLAVVILHGRGIDSEKNIYFEQLLAGLGANNPLHRLVFVKDLLHSNLMIQGTWLEKYILESIAVKKIIISKKGENHIYPLSTNDFFLGLQKILFLRNTEGKNFWLSGDPVTDLELAFLLKKYLEDSEGTEFEIDASDHDKTDNINLTAVANRTRAELDWEPKDNFEIMLRKSVQKIDEDHSLLLSSLHRSTQSGEFLLVINEKIQKIHNLISRYKKKGIRKSVENTPQAIKKISEYLLASFVLIYLLLTISFVWFTSNALIQLESSLKSVRKGNISTSVEHINKSMIYSRIGESSYSFVSPIISIFSKNIHEKNYNIFVFLRYSQSSLTNLHQTYQLAEKILFSINSQESPLDYQDISLALRSNLSLVYENLNQIKLLTSSGNLPKTLAEKLEVNQEYKNLSFIEQQLIHMLKITELIPDIIGGNTAKNIVILFQNSQELRSTGGGLDYLLTIVVDKGRVVSKKIYLAEEIDNLAEGEIVPPPLVRQFTGNDDWKTRDINYNPDFTQTSENLSWYIEKTLKFKPDAIIAASDLLFVDFLNEEKGILLDGQSVTAENFQNDMNIGEQKITYLHLIDNYLDRFLNHNVDLLTVGRVFAKQFMENNILVWSADPMVESSILDQPFSGAIYPHPCHGSISGARGCISQTTYFNESRFSLDGKARDFQRKLTHQVWIESRQIRHEYVAEYNRAPNISNLEVGLNLAIQLYIPQNSILSSVFLNEEPIPKSIIQEQLDKQLRRIQIPTYLSYDKDHKLRVTFVTPLSEPAYLPFAYSLTEYRQPGVVGEGYKLTINYPESARPAAITSEVEIGPGSMTHTFPPQTATFGVNFAVSGQ